MIRVDYALGKPVPFKGELYIRAKDIVRCEKRTVPLLGEVMDGQRTPYYVATVQNVAPGRGLDFFVVHTEDNWKMERLIKGTFHPIADLVDELQNHPSIGILPKLAVQELYNP